MKAKDKILLFHTSHQLVESELDNIEKNYKVELEREELAASEIDDQYYPQFDESVRTEAKEMARHYELFYVLEKSIRELVREKLQAEHDSDWWEECVPDEIKNNAKSNIKREKESGVTQRSSEKIDYTSFGELGEIVRHNWETFSDTFNNKKAFSKVMASLNNLRGPIAHCSPLAADEVVRLNLMLKDWFRLME